MEIPYTVSARPDTGLYNAKLGVWLFLASEVMLFGGLFSAYVFLRLFAEPGYWPHGLLNVPVGTFNTAVLIISSVTVVLAWASLKMRRYTPYLVYMGITVFCGLLFLGIKLGYEYPQKFNHFGVYLTPEALPKYEEFLGNHHLAEKELPPRVEISGHLHGIEFTHDGKHEHAENISPSQAQRILSQPGVELIAYHLEVDPVNADPTSPANDRPHFWHQGATEKPVTIAKGDVDFASAFLPKHSTYFATYFTITGLHGLHVLGGIIVFAYFLFTGGKIYRRNPEHLANRVEVAGLFWHFVDLVWIFVFPIFYLL